MAASLQIEQELCCKDKKIKIYFVTHFLENI